MFSLFRFPYFGKTGSEDGELEFGGATSPRRELSSPGITNALISRDNSQRAQRTYKAEGLNFTNARLCDVVSVSF